MKDNVIPLEYAAKFEQKLSDAKCVRIEDSSWNNSISQINSK